MTRRFAWKGSKRLKGVSLIELMISITIGLIIIGAVFSAYLGAAGASRMADAQGRMDEDAQAALVILAQQLRLAGVNPAQPWTANLNYSTDTSIYNPVYLPQPNYTNAAYAPFETPTYVDSSRSPVFALSDYTVRGCEGSFDNVNTSDNLDNLKCTTDLTIPNSVGVNYEADIYNTVPATAGTAGAIPTDCLGNPLYQIKAEIPQAAPASSSAPPSSSSTSPAHSSSSSPAPASSAPATYNPVYYYEADNRFYVGKNQSQTTPSLYCQGNGKNSVAQPLVQNVEDLQISYGVQTPSATTSTVAGYLTADQLLAQGALTAQGLTEAGRWKKVITARICVQMRSDTLVMPTFAAGTYLKCDGTVATPTDLRLRHSYTTTVVLRNRLL